MRNTYILLFGKVLKYVKKDIQLHLCYHFHLSFSHKVFTYRLDYNIISTAFFKSLANER